MFNWLHNPKRTILPYRFELEEELLDNGRIKMSLWTWYEQEIIAGEEETFETTGDVVQRIKDWADIERAKALGVAEKYRAVAKLAKEFE